MVFSMLRTAPFPIQMTNPQYTLTIALGVGPEGEQRRKLYEKAAGGRPLSQWVREALEADYVDLSTETMRLK